MLPFLSDIYSALDDRIDAISAKNIVFWTLGFLLSGKTIASVLGFISIIISVNDSAPSPASLSTVHAFAQVFSSFARAIGPAVSGALWSWSLENSIFPFDFHFTLFVVSGIAMGSFFLTFLLNNKH
jgi:hypothetical protein